MGRVKRRRAVGEGGEEKADWMRMEGEGGEGSEEHWRGEEAPFIQEENKTPRSENDLLPISQRHYFYFSIKLFGALLLTFYLSTSILKISYSSSNSAYK